jgi:hypothetical protein
LKTLDTFVPGQWENLVGFDHTIKTITGETDEAMVQAIGERAIALFNDKSQGYQRALWLYESVDSASGMLGSSCPSQPHRPRYVSRLSQKHHPQTRKGANH